MVWARSRIAYKTSHRLLKHLSRYLTAECCDSLVFWNTVNFVGFSVIHVSQGSVATYVRYGGISTKPCIANFLLSLSVKEFLKLVKIWQSDCQSLGACFLEHGVYNEPRIWRISSNLPSSFLLFSSAGQWLPKRDSGEYHVLPSFTVRLSDLTWLYKPTVSALRRKWQTVKKFLDANYQHSRYRPIVYKITTNNFTASRR